MSGSWNGTIFIWKISSGENIRRIDVGKPVFTIRVLLNGFQIAFGLNTNNDNFRIYNYSSGD